MRKRETECEAAVYLPNKLDRISSIIKEEREMGKTQTYTHTRTKASLGVWHTTHTLPSLTHIQTHMHTYLQINILAHVQYV